MIKAIFFDVDGTLLSHRTGRISPHTRACIRALRAGGTLVFLSTGRHILELRSLPVGEMAFDGYITLNGQLCLDSSQQQLSSTPLPPQAVQALADLFCADGPPLALPVLPPLSRSWIPQRKAGHKKCAKPHISHV